MKEWRMNDSKSTTLLMSEVTLLKGRVDKWLEVIELFRQTFDSKKIDIYEGEEKLNINDYCLNILSYTDDYHSTDSVNAKTNLKNLFTAYLELSPFYKNLVGSWEELQEEVELLSHELGYSQKIQLNNFPKKIVEEHLKWKTNMGSQLDGMVQQINLTRKFIPDKRHIFILIHPEEVLVKKELSELYNLLERQSSYFILVGNFLFDGTTNLIYKNRIINQLLISRKKEQIASLLPFVFDEKDFDIALNWYITIVENSKDKTIDLSISSVDNLRYFIYVFLMIYVTELPLKVDFMGIPQEYKRFIDSVIESKV